jgi:hypothetical protein
MIQFIKPHPMLHILIPSLKASKYAYIVRELFIFTNNNKEHTTGKELNQILTGICLGLLILNENRGEIISFHYHFCLQYVFKCVFMQSTCFCARG